MNLSQDLKKSLRESIKTHIAKERASFHTPGHKGHSWQSNGALMPDPYLAEDLTELPGLDELAYPSGVILQLEKEIAQIWGAHTSLISVNGASAGIIAAILLLKQYGTHLLVPRNCHRSVIHGLVLSGLKPIWFEPFWESDWGFWGAPDIDQISNVLKQNPNNKIAGIFITSPTYAGTMADIETLSSLAEKYKIPLIVDEAQGTQLLWSYSNKTAALNAGAHIVIHSLHKTLSSLTQTGLVHISKNGFTKYAFSELELRRSLSLIQSSSPSYLFLNSINKLVTALSSGHAQKQIQRVEELALKLREYIKEKTEFQLYEPSCEIASMDVLIKNNFINAVELQELLISHGVFPETILGNGLLLLLGIGTEEKDIEILIESLNQIDSMKNRNKKTKFNLGKPKPIVQVLDPREAFFSQSIRIQKEKAIGKISAECLAPCPPGWPVLVPGQKIGSEVLEFEEIKEMLVIK